MIYSLAEPHHRGHLPAPLSRSSPPSRGGERETLHAQPMIKPTLALAERAEATRSSASATWRATPADARRLHLARRSRVVLENPAPSARSSAGPSTPAAASSISAQSARVAVGARLATAIAAFVIGIAHRRLANAARSQAPPLERLVNGLDHRRGDGRDAADREAQRPRPARLARLQPSPSTPHCQLKPRCASLSRCARCCCAMHHRFSLTHGCRF